MAVTENRPWVRNKDQRGAREQRRGRENSCRWFSGPSQARSQGRDRALVEQKALIREQREWRLAENHSEFSEPMFSPISYRAGGGGGGEGTRGAET